MAFGLRARRSKGFGFRVSGACRFRVQGHGIEGQGENCVACGTVAPHEGDSKLRTL